MSLNNILSRAKSVFVGRHGLRPGWRAAAALTACLGWNILARAFFTWLFALLFDAWGVNSLNLGIAPAWVRAAVNGYPYAVSLLVNLPAALVFSLLFRSMPGARPTSVCAAFGALGVGAVIAPGVIFLLADSMRLVRPVPEFHWPIAASLPICIIAAWAEHALSRGYVQGVMRRSHGKLMSYAASATAFLILTGAWNLGWLGFVNMLLMSVLLSAVTERFGHCSAIALRAGWSWAANSLLGFSGGEIALFSLYPVSEILITGGSGGLVNGLFTTALLSVGIWLMLQNELRAAIQKLRKKSPMV